MMNTEKRTVSIAQRTGRFKGGFAALSPSRQAARSRRRRRSPSELFALHSSSTASRRAFSIAELLIVISISSVLFLSLSAALSGTLHTTTEVARQLASWHTVSSALLRMERELGGATQMVSTQDTRVSFYVPDITGDGSDDLVEYSWDGDDGDALVRTLNGGSALELLPDAREVAFSYKYRQSELFQIADASKNIDVVPAAFERYEEDYQSKLRDITPSRWRAQRFTPTTDSHRTDSVSFNLQTTPSMFWGTGDLLVSLKEVDTNTTIAMGIVHADDLKAALGEFQTFAIPMTWQHPDGSGTSTEKEYRWVLQPWGPSYAGTVERLEVTAPVGPENSMMYEWSANGGASFLNMGTKADIPFVTKGTYALEYGISTQQTVSRLRCMNIYLKYGTGKHEVAINSAVKLNNL